MNGCCILSNAFSASIEITVVIFVFDVLVLFFSLLIDELN